MMINIYKRLLRSVREYKKDSWLAIAFISLEVIMETALPFLMSVMVNSISSEDFTRVAIVAVVMILAASVSFCGGYFAGKYAARASAGFAKNLRQDLYYQIQDFSFTNIDEISSSGLITRMTTDVSNIQNTYGMLIRIAIRAPLMMICSTIFACIINPILSLIFLAFIPILGVIFYFAIRRCIKIYTEGFQRIDELNANIEENIDGIRVVKSFVKENEEKAKFKKTSGIVRKTFLKGEYIMATGNPLIFSAISICITLLFFFGTHIIIDTFKGFDGDIYLYGSLSPAQLSSLMAYGTQILSSLMMLTMILAFLSMSIASARRILEVLETTSDITDPQEPIFEVKDGSIDFNNVSFKYKKTADKCALKNINLHIKSGMTVGIIGGTGSAKSTLVNLLSRLYDPTYGEVKVGGQNVKDYNVKALRDQVAVVLQKNVLFAGTIKENLRWGNKDASDEEVIEAARIAQADSFIRDFQDGYDTLIDQGGKNVSGGQKQRLCIARALLKNPKILVLDDSTSAVDTKTDKLIMDELKRTKPEVTKIIIAQRLSSISSSDLIIVMEDGEIAAMGLEEDLLKTSPIYKEIYKIQKSLTEEKGVR